MDNLSRADEEALLAEADYHEQRIIDGDATHNTPDGNEPGEALTSRVKERLDLHYHSMKEREKPITFREVREWLREMDDTETQSLHNVICPVVHRHCAGIQLPHGTNGLENDLIDALTSRASVAAGEGDTRLNEIRKRLELKEAGPTWYSQQEHPLINAIIDARYLMIALGRAERRAAASSSLSAELPPIDPAGLLEAVEEDDRYYALPLRWFVKSAPPRGYFLYEGDAAGREVEAIVYLSARSTAETIAEKHNARLAAPAETPEDYNGTLLAFTEWWRGFCSMDGEHFPTDQREIGRAAFFAGIAYTNRTEPQDEGANTL